MCVWQGLWSIVAWRGSRGVRPGLPPTREFRILAATVDDAQNLSLKTRDSLRALGILASRQHPDLVRVLLDTDRLTTLCPWTVGAICLSAVDSRNTGQAVNSHCTERLLGAHGKPKKPEHVLKRGADSQLERLGFRVQGLYSQASVSLGCIVVYIPRPPSNPQ